MQRVGTEVHLLLCQVWESGSRGFHRLYYCPKADCHTGFSQSCQFWQFLHLDPAKKTATFAFLFLERTETSVPLSSFMVSGSFASLSFSLGMALGAGSDLKPEAVSAAGRQAGGTSRGRRQEADASGKPGGGRRRRAERAAVAGSAPAPYTALAAEPAAPAPG